MSWVDVHIVILEEGVHTAPVRACRLVYTVLVSLLQAPLEVQGSSNVTIKLVSSYLCRAIAIHLTILFE